MTDYDQRTGLPTRPTSEIVLEDWKVYTTTPEQKLLAAVNGLRDDVHRLITEQVTTNGLLSQLLKSTKTKK